MKTKKEKRNWILKHCVDRFGQIDLNNLDFSGYHVNINNMKADTISQSNHTATIITQRGHHANQIIQGHHAADFIDQPYMKTWNLDESNCEIKKIYTVDLSKYEKKKDKYGEDYYELKEKENEN